MCIIFEYSSDLMFGLVAIVCYEEKRWRYLNHFKRRNLLCRQKKLALLVLVLFGHCPAFAAEKPTQFVLKPEEFFFLINSSKERKEILEPSE